MFFTQPHRPRSSCPCCVEEMLKTATPEFKEWWLEASKLEKIHGFSNEQAKPTLYSRLLDMIKRKRED